MIGIALFGIVVAAASCTGRLSLEPALYCPPQPIATVSDGPVVERVRIEPGDRLPTPGVRMRLIAEVLVLETGALQHLRQTSFLPALLEGMPVAGRYRTDGSRPRP